MIAKLFSFMDKLDEDREFRREMNRVKAKLIRDGLSVLHGVVSSYLNGYVNDAPQTVSRPPTKDEIQAVIEQLERDNYIPEPASRAVSGDQITYRRTTDLVVPPGKIVSLQLGISQFEEGSCWPGIPETGRSYFGVSEPFKPKTIAITPGFGLCAMFMGQWNAFPNAPNENVAIPAEFLANNPQPDFHMCPKFVSISVQIKNISKRQLPGWVMVTGVEVKDDGK